MLMSPNRRLRRRLRAQLRLASHQPANSLQILMAPPFLGWDLLSPSEQEKWRELRRLGPLLTWKDRYESSFKPTFDALHKQYIQAAASAQWTEASAAIDALFRKYVTLHCYAPKQISGQALLDLGLTRDELTQACLEARQKLIAV